MSFSEAIMYLKNGYKVCRKNWNGKSQYICLAYMTECRLLDGTRINDPLHDNIGSKFVMFVGTAGYQCGWLASQADMLANDWCIFEEV